MTGVVVVARLVSRRPAHLHREPELLPGARQTAPLPPAPDAPLPQKGSADARHSHLQQEGHTCCRALQRAAAVHCCRSATLGSRRIQGNARGQHGARPPAADRDTHGPRDCKELPGAGWRGIGTQSHFCRQAQTRAQDSHDSTHDTEAPGAQGGHSPDCAAGRDSSLWQDRTRSAQAALISPCHMPTTDHTRWLHLPIHQLAGPQAPYLSASSAGPSGWPLPSPAAP